MRPAKTASGTFATHANASRRPLAKVGRLRLRLPLCAQRRRIFRLWSVWKADAAGSRKVVGAIVASFGPFDEADIRGPIEPICCIEGNINFLGYISFDINLRLNN